MIVPVGQPIPLDEHACSVSLPQWSDVVGYEEGDPDVTMKMVCGYPRFVYHPYIVRLMQAALALDSRNQNSDCIVLPSKAAAYRARDFLIRATLLNHDEPESSCPSLTKLTSRDNALDFLDDEEEEEDQVQFGEGDIRIINLKTSANIYALLFPAETKYAIAAKAYWQHTGEVVSSRRAEAALTELGSFLSSNKPTRVTHALLQIADSTRDTTATCPISQQDYVCKYPSQVDFLEDPKTLLRERLAEITHIPPDRVHLTPSGMAAIYFALRAARRQRLSKDYGGISKDYGGLSIVYGFPYLDTLKQCSRPELCPGGVEFFGNGDQADLASLERMLHKRREYRRRTDPTADAGVCVLITEFPSNPLLNCHDLRALRALANEYNFCLVVDDTIGNFANVDLISTGIADMLCTSLTKLFSGRGDVMAGSLICNPYTEMGDKIGQAMLNKINKDDLYHADAVAMYHNSTDFLERSTQINHTAEKLADWLKEHDNIETVYYPKFTQPDLYQALMHRDPRLSHTPGYGGLMSILLHSHICQRTFYDTLQIYKGPSLGTNFSLACPYTLLAHYFELDFARAYKVSPNLIRISVGLEPLEVLQERFQYALKKSRLHPPLRSFSMDQQRASFSTLASKPRPTNLGFYTKPSNSAPLLGQTLSLRNYNSPPASRRLSVSTLRTNRPGLGAVYWVYNGAATALSRLL